MNFYQVQNYSESRPNLFGISKKYMKYVNYSTDG